MESLLQIVPGQTLAVFYEDDTVWHERIAIWRQEDGVWMILTPDDDRYVEDLRGLEANGGDGPSRTKVYKVDFQYWSRVGGPAYRFRDKPSDDKFKALVKEAYRELSNLPGFDQAWRPPTVMDMKGASHPTAEFLAGALNLRRITRRGGGVVEGEDLDLEELRESQLKFRNGVRKITAPPPGKCDKHGGQASVQARGSCDR